MSGTLILAGGGTGGHVFPLLAVAEALKAERPDLRLLFVGTARGMEQKLVPSRGFELELLPVLPMRGGGILGGLRGALRAAELVPACLRLLRRVGASGVLSIGGYAAGPMTVASFVLGLPLGVIEPNSVPGLANRLAAPLAARAYLAFDEAENSFAPGQIRGFGVPIRAGFGPRPLPPFEGGPLRVLVLGGSQGSRALNETFPLALEHLRHPLKVVHQSGAEQGEGVAHRYLTASEKLPPGRLSYEVVPFIEDMPAALGRAHLIVGRSGASAVSELLAVGRPSLLVPYPFASGDHQRLNALELERKGAALTLPSRDLSPERVAADLNMLLGDLPRLARMAERARTLGRSQAAQQIAKDFLALLREAP